MCRWLLLLLLLLLLLVQVKADQMQGDVVCLPLNAFCSLHVRYAAGDLQVKAGWKVQGDVVCLPLNVTMKCMRVLAPDMHCCCCCCCCCRSRLAGRCRVTWCACR
jgi:hypothetical protein